MSSAATGSERPLFADYNFLMVSPVNGAVRGPSRREGAADMPAQVDELKVRLLLWYSGLAQAGEISGFDQSADLRYAPILGGPEANDA